MLKVNVFIRPFLYIESEGFIVRKQVKSFQTYKILLVMTKPRKHRELLILLLAGSFIMGLTFCGNPKSEEVTSATTTNSNEAISVEEIEELPPLEQGKALYTSYCQLCHGDNAVGDGAMAELLKIPPPDLTQISARYNGFPTAQIAEIISGKQRLDGHGSNEMPIWWTTFQVSEAVDSEAEVQAKIDYLVAYLESLQAS